MAKPRGDDMLLALTSAASGAASAYLWWGCSSAWTAAFATFWAVYSILTAALFVLAVARAWSHG